LVLQQPLSGDGDIGQIGERADDHEARPEHVLKPEATERGAEVGASGGEVHQEIHPC
jgi:hypothetical protein